MTERNRPYSLPRTVQTNHTTGPFRGRYAGDTGNIRLYSEKTGETVATILSREWGDYENAPDGVTALANFQLFRHAAAMLAILEHAIDTEERNWDGPADEPSWLRQARDITAKARGIVDNARMPLDPPP